MPPCSWINSTSTPGVVLLLFVPLCTMPETLPAWAPAAAASNSKESTGKSHHRNSVFHFFICKMNPRVLDAQDPRRCAGPLGPGACNEKPQAEACATSFSVFERGSKELPFI